MISDKILYLQKLIRLNLLFCQNKNISEKYAPLASTTEENNPNTCQHPLVQIDVLDTAGHLLGLHGLLHTDHVVVEDVTESDDQEDSLEYKDVTHFPQLFSGIVMAVRKLVFTSLICMKTPRLF